MGQRKHKSHPKDGVGGERRVGCYRFLMLSALLVRDSSAKLSAFSLFSLANLPDSSEAPLEILREFQPFLSRHDRSRILIFCALFNAMCLAFK